MPAMLSGLDARHLRGPFAVIGDVHGCVFTLDALLRQLGGSLSDPVPGLTLVSVGDLHDKGGPSAGPLSGEPGSVEVLRWAMRESAAGRLLTLDSNHGALLVKLIRAGKRPSAASRGAAERTLAQLQAAPDAGTLLGAVEEFLGSLPPYLRLTVPSGEMVVAHAAASERLMHASTLSHQERSFHLRSQSFRWQGQASVVVGHVSVPAPQVTRERRPDGSLAGPVIRIDTGVDDGGPLTAYLPHDDAFVSVPRDARDTWRFGAVEVTADSGQDDRVAVPA